MNKICNYEILKDARLCTKENADLYITFTKLQDTKNSFLSNRSLIASSDKKLTKLIQN